MNFPSFLLKSTQKYINEAADILKEQSVKKWRKFHDLMIQRYSKHKTCILRYENLTKDLIHELMPCLEFLGFGLDPILVECILQGISLQTE